MFVFFIVPLFFFTSFLSRLFIASFMVADCGLRQAIATNVGGGLRQASSQMQFTERGFQSRSRQSHNLQIAIGSLQIRIGSLHLRSLELIGLYSGKFVARFLDSFF